MLKELSGYAVGIALILLMELLLPPADWPVLLWMQKIAGGAIGVGMVAWWFIHHDGKRPSGARAASRRDS